MNETLRRAGFHVCICAAAVVLTAGCAQRPHPSPTSTETARISTLLVVPFKDMSRSHEIGIAVRSPLSGNMFLAGPVEEGAADFLTESLTRFVASQTQYRLVPHDQAEGVRSQIVNREGRLTGELEFLVELGAELGVDGVLVGHVYRFRDRVGMRFAADTPASVAFEVYLVNVKEGGLTWGGQYDESQRSLTENLLMLSTFFKRGAAWVTARELAQSGLDELLRHLPRPGSPPSPP